MKARGQMNFLNLLLTVFTFIGIYITLPIMQSAIDATPAGLDPMIVVLLKLTPALMILGLVAVFYIYIFPRQGSK